MLDERAVAVLKAEGPVTLRVVDIDLMLVRTSSGQTFNRWGTPERALRSAEIILAIFIPTAIASGLELVRRVRRGAASA